MYFLLSLLVLNWVDQIYFVLATQTVSSHIALSDKALLTDGFVFNKRKPESVIYVCGNCSLYKSFLLIVFLFLLISH